MKTTPRSFRIAVLLLASASWLQAANPPGGTCSGGGGPCDQESGGTSSGGGSGPYVNSISWGIKVGLARYPKPSTFTDFAQAAYEKNGNLPDFNQLYSRYYSDSPFQQKQIHLELSQTQLDASTFHPSCLFLQSEALFETLKKPAANGFPEYIHQILTDDTFTLIDMLPAPESGWRLRVWKRNASPLTKTGGYYVTSGFETKTPLNDVVFKRPSGTSGNNTLLYIEKETTGLSGTRTTTKEIVQINDASGKAQSVVLSIYAGEGTAGSLLSREDLTYTRTPGSKAWDYTIERQVWTSTVNASGTIGGLQLTGRTLEDYDDYSTTAAGGSPGMKRLVAKTEAYNTSGQLPQTTTYSYINTPSNPTTHGRMLTEFRPDGSWEAYDYAISPGSPVAITTKYSGWKDLGISQKEQARKTVTKVSATESTVETYVADKMISKSRTTLEPGPSGAVTTTGNWDGSGWHLTTTGYYSDTAAAPSTGRIKWIEHSDGTATTYSYATVGGNLVTTELKGSGSRSGVTAGTQIKIVHGLGNIPIESETKDIATGLITEHWVTDMSYNSGLDSIGRPIKRIYNADVTDYDITQYACCGLEESRDRDGTITKYFRDGLKRVYKTEFRASAVSPVVSTFTTVEGLTTTQSRRFGDSDALFLGSTARSLDGLTTVVTGPSRKSNVPADRPVTTSVTNRTATGNTVTTSHADGSNSVASYYLDGQPKSIGGTAIPDESYEYGTHNENGGGLISVVNSSGVSSTVFQDLLGRTTKTVSSATGTTTQAYHPLNASPGSRGKLASITDGDGVAVSYGYDSEGERTTTSRLIPLADGSSATQVTTSEENVVSNATLHGVSLGISRHQIQTVSTTGMNPVTVFESFVSRDGLLSGSRSFGSETLTEVIRPDASGTFTRTIVQPDATRTVETVTHGLPSSIEAKDGAGNVINSTSYSYDALQRLASSTDSRTGATIYTSHTESGQALTTTTPGNLATTVTLDILGRTIATSLPDNSVTHTSYWPTGQIKAKWGSQTNPVFHVYDEQNRLIELHTWQSAPALDQSTASPPSGSAKTEWQYSATTGHLSRKQYDDEKGTDYTYTPAGRLASRVWERGITTEYAYTHGMMTFTDYSDTTPDVTITYDALGRQATTTQANQSQVTFSYDPATLQLDTETVRYDLDHNGSWDFTRTIDRSRDTLQRDTGWELKDGTTLENQVTYGYSAATGRLQTVTNAAETFTYGYRYDQTAATDPRVGSITGTKLDIMPYTVGKSGSPALQTLRTYEASRDVLGSIQNKAGAATRSSYTYTVNELGQREDVTTTFDFGSGSGIIANPGQTEWNYDNLGQLESANAPDAAGVSADRYYAYDSIGNRLRARAGTATNTGGTLTEYFGTISPSPVAGANSLNQYVGIAKGGVTLQPVHDDDGNATAYPVPAHPAANSTLAWDGENRLTGATVNGDTSVCLYDAQSRRIVKVSGGVTTLYLYDGFNCIAEYSGGILSKTYTWGLDLSGTLQGAGGVGGLLATKHGATSYYPTYDGNGNISEYLKIDGDVAAHFEYDPFGNTVVNTDSAGIFSYRFSTKPLDSATGLYYYQYRHYDPVTGRWPSRDPIEEEGGVNLYAFVGNSGVNRWDRLGLYTIQDAVAKLKERGVEPAGTPNPLDPAGSESEYSDTQKFDEWLSLESGDTSWLDSLPDCPDKICVKDGKPQNCDSNQWDSLTTAGGLHEGSDYCMRSKGGQSGQQCCYSLSEDGKSLELETSLPAAGTPDRVAATAANGLFTGHYSHDVEPYEFAQRLNRIDAYGQARPPNQGGGTCN